MKIAVPFHHGYVNEHFGHSESYAIFTISADLQIETRGLVRAEEGCGCKSGIADVLAREGVTLMLAGNIGGGAINHLQSRGIDVVRGCAGEAEEVVIQYLKGEVTDGGQTCNHHQGCEDHHH
jgi:predicted Fe-Mo cluster-binding NifX family protein